jgi:hypothetical protein
MSDKQDEILEEEEDTTDLPDTLNMSDEDFLKMGAPGAPVAASLEEELASAAPQEGDADPEDKDEESTDADDEDGDKPAEEVADGDDKPAAAEDKAPPADDKVEKAEPKAEEKSEEQAAVNYEAEYKRLIAPFKANGRDIQVKSVDDAIVLMQMGANYNKKMAALKPNLKLMKLLDNNGLLSEDKISFLIDLEKKNPAAINKLVKDSGIDPLDLDADKASAYKQTAYTVDDREIELDTVLDDIQGTPSYNRTLDIVSNKWDAASKGVIAGSPQLLKVINDHISNGIYDVITKEIENERTFGRLVGVSDIEAYRQVGDALHARGGFNHLVQGSSQAQGKPAAAPVVVTPKPKQVDDGKLKDKKRAASSTKPAVSGSGAQDFNPLSMSDEEFSKIANKQFS